MKIKHFKREVIDFQKNKPLIKKRKNKFGQFIKEKLVANLKEDETPSEFPDTRSIED